VTGAYTKIDQSPMSIRYPENLIRSANAPAMSAGVMIANISWNTMKAVAGTLGA
jgi:hypothetical protein